MLAGRRPVTPLTTGTLATLATFATLTALARPAAAESLCPATLVPGEVCAVVETVVEPIPLAPEPTSPVPSPSSPPSTEERAPEPSTPPGAGTASPAQHPAAPSPSSTAPAASGEDRAAAAPPVAGETAREVDLPALIESAPPFVLGPAPVPSASATVSRPTGDGPSELAAVRSLPGGDLGEGGLPPTSPITLAVLLVAGVLGAHGVRWVDRQLASSAASASGVDTGARQA